MNKRIAKYRRIIMAALIAATTLVVDYWEMNQSVTLGSEKIKLQILEYIRQRLTEPQSCNVSDSVLMVDVHYDKVMVTERKQAPDGKWMEMGQVPVTDREKLLRLLRYLKEHDDYRYVMLDVRLEASTNQPEDMALWNTIASMPRLVMARPLDSKMASPLLREKEGAAQYNTALWETDFLKYPLYTDTIPSMALKMYRESTKHDIRQWGPLWIDGYRLARSSLILTWDLVDCSERFYLGDLINDWEEGDDEEWDGSPKGKYVLIGDFEDDIHPTFFGEMSGTLLIYNAYQSLLQQRHLLSPFLLIMLFGLFVVLAWLTLSRNHLFTWLCSFWGYVGFLFLFCVFTYLTFNEVYDILMTTLIFYALKTGIEWYEHRHKIHTTTKRINNIIKNKVIKMKKIRIFRTLTIISFLLTTETLHAVEPEIFRIEFMNCKSIQIGDRWLHTRDTFMSNKIIHWKNGRQYMRVRSLNNPKKVYGVTLEGFKEAKVQTLHDFLVKTNSASTKGVLSSRHYSQVCHCLVDTLHFQAFDEPQPDVIVEAVWKRPDGSEQVTRLQRTSDSAFYIVTRDILGQGTSPDSILLDIRERPTNDDWINRIYRQIPIRCLPMQVDD